MLKTYHYFHQKNCLKSLNLNKKNVYEQRIYMNHEYAANILIDAIKKVKFLQIQAKSNAVCASKQ